MGNIHVKKLRIKYINANHLVRIYYDYPHHTLHPLLRPTSHPLSHMNGTSRLRPNQMYPLICRLYLQPKLLSPHYLHPFHHHRLLYRHLYYRPQHISPLRQVLTAADLFIFQLALTIPPIHQLNHILLHILLLAMLFRITSSNPFKRLILNLTQWLYFASISSPLSPPTPIT